MEKEFISYNLAVRLKVLGFDEPCFTYYTSKASLVMGLLEISDGFTLEDLDKGILAPLYQQAFRFLIPLQDEFKVCLGENGWYIYNLENEMYEQDALEKMIEIVEKYK